MTRKSKTTEEPRRSPRKGSTEPDAERSDRNAGAGRPVQLDEEGRSRAADSDSPRPADDGPVPK